MSEASYVVCFVEETLVAVTLTTTISTFFKFLYEKFNLIFLFIYRCIEFVCENCHSASWNFLNRIFWTQLVHNSDCLFLLKGIRNKVVQNSDQHYGQDMLPQCTSTGWPWKVLQFNFFISKSWGEINWYNLHVK